MLGLLRRLHRMHVQFSLECESQETGIRYPHLERHKVKDGHGKAVIDSVRLIADADICQTVLDSKEEAKDMMKELGMFELLQSHGDWENPPTPLLGHATTFDDKDEDDDDEVAKSDEVCAELLQEANASQDDEDVASGISDLLTGGIINEEEHENLINLHRTGFRQLPSKESIPLYEEVKKGYSI